jgi:preprotein translocase SecE subunit
MLSPISFLKEVRAEFKHISWPKKDTLIQLSIVVISISVITSLILGGFDYIFTKGLALLGSQPQSNLNQKTVVDPLSTLAPTPTIEIIKK